MSARFLSLNLLDPAAVRISLPNDEKVGKGGYSRRHNDVLESPRELVEAVGKPVEMKRSGKRMFCCGAGGAHMWMEERGGKINQERAREAAETGAATLAVACPFCTVMLDDGVRARGDELRVADVSTLLAESLEQRTP